ncbi:MAG TPA: hypothetical protein VGF38_22070 [Ktedonobacterales bacterium]
MACREARISNDESGRRPDRRSTLCQQFLHKVATPGGNTGWQHRVATPGGNTGWQHRVATPGGNTKNRLLTISQEAVNQR